MRLGAAAGVERGVVEGPALALEAFADAGAPAGVVNLVQGARETGQALLEQPIDGLLFTGSAGAGNVFRRAFADRPDVILALELGGEGIRVNGVNADRIRSGLLTDDFIEKRAEARGVSTADYMAGNLLRAEVEATHVAEAFVALARADRTTAHVMTVDGGNIEAALR